MIRKFSTFRVENLEVFLNSPKQNQSFWYLTQFLFSFLDINRLNGRAIIDLKLNQILVLTIQIFSSSVMFRFVLIIS